MTHNYHHQIDRIVKANKVYRFEAELEETQDKTRIETLTKLIELHNAYKDEHQIKTDKLQAHLKVLKESQYQKKWQFLNQEQRLNRLNEFIERKELKNAKIIKLLIEAVTQGTLKTKVVEYDKIKCQIQQLSVLVIDDNTKEYHLNRVAIGKGDDNSDQEHAGVSVDHEQDKVSVIKRQKKKPVKSPSLAKECDESKEIKKKIVKKSTPGAKISKTTKRSKTSVNE